MWASFGQQFLLTGNATAADILVTTSHALAQRFVPAVQAFESWGPLHPPNEQIQVIVDSSEKMVAARPLHRAQYISCVCSGESSTHFLGRGVHRKCHPHSHGHRARRYVAVSEPVLLPNLHD